MPKQTERFSDPSRQVLAASEAVAKQLKHPQLTAHHVFLALLKIKDTEACKLLTEMGFDYDAALEVAKKYPPARLPLFGKADTVPKEVKHVLMLAVEEARKLNHPYISTNHFLLAFARKPTQAITEIVQHFGQDLQIIRQRVLQTIDQSLEEEETGIDSWRWLSLHKGYRSEPFVEAAARTCVVPLDENHQILLLTELAATNNQPVLILPGGIIREGEEPAESASREIHKKTGYKAARLDFLAKLDVQPKYAVWAVHGYLARDLTLIKPDVDSTIERVSLADFEALIQSGRLTDSTTIACLYLTRQFLGK